MLVFRTSRGVSRPLGTPDRRPAYSSLAGSPFSLHLAVSQGVVA